MLFFLARKIWTTFNEIDGRIGFSHGGASYQRVKSNGAPCHVCSEPCLFFELKDYVAHLHQFGQLRSHALGLIHAYFTDVLAKHMEGTERPWIWAIQSATRVVITPRRLCLAEIFVRASLNQLTCSRTYICTFILHLCVPLTHQEYSNLSDGRIQGLRS